MPFRDELEAARARIEKLERDLVTLKAERERETQGEPPFAIATVVLALIVVGMGAGIAMLWNRVSEAEEAAASWRELEGQTGNELHEAQIRLDEARRAASVGPMPHTFGRGWPADDTVDPQAWSGVVVERIGDAPVSVEQICTFTIEQVAPARADAPGQCAARARCGEIEVYPAPGESDLVMCTVDVSAERHGALVPGIPLTPGSRRLRRVGSEVDVDDGAPVGTWSLRMVELLTQ